MSTPHKDFNFIVTTCKILDGVVKISFYVVQMKFWFMKTSIYVVKTLA